MGHGDRLVRVIFTTACRDSVTKRVILESQRQMTRNNITTIPLNKIDSWKLALLNIKGKRYTTENLSTKT